MKKLLLISLFPTLMFFTACGDGDKSAEINSIKDALTKNQQALKAATDQLNLTTSQRDALQKALDDQTKAVDESCRGLQDDTRNLVTTTLVSLSSVSDESTRGALQQQLLQAALGRSNNDETRGVGRCRKSLEEFQLSAAISQGTTQGLFDSKKALEATIKGLVQQYVIPQALLASQAASAQTGTSSTTSLTNLLSLGSTSLGVVRGIMANSSSSRFKDATNALAQDAQRGLQSTTATSAQAYIAKNNLGGSGRGIASRSIGSAVNNTAAADSNRSMRTQKTSVNGKNLTLVY